MKNLARIGCLARSLVYFIMGVLALMVAKGDPDGATTDEVGVFRRVEYQPFGKFLLLTLAAGLFCYAIWRIFQAVQDRDKYGNSLNGLSIRLAFLFSGLAHVFFGFYALNLIFHWTTRTAAGERLMAHRVLMQPYGREILGGIGISVILTGFFQFLRAFKGDFTRGLRINRRNRFLFNVCRFGLLARGVVFAIIGCFLFEAAWKNRSREAGGLHKAWETLHSQPFGNFLLGAVAIGFMAFAIFGFIEGFYRKRLA